jgi:hypothetical protein
VNLPYVDLRKPHYADTRYPQPRDSSPEHIGGANAGQLPGAESLYEPTLLLSLKNSSCLLFSNTSNDELDNPSRAVAIGDIFTSQDIDV